jgi:hypothetical protein
MKYFPNLLFLDLTYADGKSGLTLLNSDVEDSIHYILSQKKNCDTILTNNEKRLCVFQNTNY